MRDLDDMSGTEIDREIARIQGKIFSGPRTAEDECRLIVLRKRKFPGLEKLRHERRLVARAHKLRW